MSDTAPPYLWPHLSTAELSTRYSKFLDQEILFALAENAFYGTFCNCMIEVRHLSGDQYEVRVTNGTDTTHQVTLKDADLIRLGGPDISGDALIAESFR